MIENIGADIYRSWTDEKRREEIDKLIEGYRNGLPVTILCTMATAIAGNERGARKHIIKLMPLRERKALVAKEAGNDRDLQVHLTRFFI
ncbi:hypothetical protein [Geotalea sp. SG265]|uniref:hypothetical protein n=1 Tax=Geotalea sp. SG265 TaxID=2922867 RepID=UPI001FAF7C10|nr:hypothetical protein [Geotalea sp. SG265]